MTDDSVTHNVDAKEANYHVVTGDGNAVISDVEIETVINFISTSDSSQFATDSTPHFISSMVNTPKNLEFISENSNSIEDDRLMIPEVDLSIRSPQVIDIETEAVSNLENFNQTVTEAILENDSPEKLEANPVIEEATLESNLVGEETKPESNSGSENIKAENLQPESDLVGEDIKTKETKPGSENIKVENLQPESKPNIQPNVVENTKNSDLINSLDGIITDEDPDAVVATANHNIQVKIHHEPERLVITLPSESQSSNIEYTWSEIWQQLKQRLNAGDRLRVPNTNVHLIVGDRLLDARQLQELAESLGEVKLQLKSVSTSRRQTAIASVTAGYSVEQNQLTAQNSLTADFNQNVSPLSEPLYMETTIRSGIEIRHPGTVTILGDVNPGGSIIADGDILVWGRLRGIAHAGARGNSECLIMALQMEPTQLRIADAVARAPEKPPRNVNPEVAYITPQGIRIVKASDFSRNKVNSTS